MNLIPVYERLSCCDILWRLLAERSASESISHKGMPSYEEHVKFVKSEPYEAWYFIKVDTRIVGSVYLSRQNEIGVFLFNGEKGNGYGPQAIKAVMEKHGKRRYLANINPDNARSIAAFEKLGFKPIQQTFECRT